MYRKQIYLEKNQIEFLNKYSDALHITYSEAIRQALDKFIAEKSTKIKKKALLSAAGLWKDRKDLPDFSKIRKSLFRDYMFDDKTPS